MEDNSPIRGHHDQPHKPKLGKVKVDQDDSPQNLHGDSVFQESPTIPQLRKQHTSTRRSSTIRETQQPKQVKDNHHAIMNDDSHRIEIEFASLMAQNLLDDHSLKLIYQNLPQKEIRGSKKPKPDEAFSYSNQGAVSPYSPKPSNTNQVTPKAAHRFDGNIGFNIEPKKIESLKSNEDFQKHSSREKEKTPREYSVQFQHEPFELPKELNQVTLKDNYPIVVVQGSSNPSDHKAKKHNLMADVGSLSMISSPCNRFVHVTRKFDAGENDPFLITNEASDSAYFDVYEGDCAASLDTLDLEDNRRIITNRDAAGYRNLLTDCVYSSFIPYSPWLVWLSKAGKFSYVEFRDSAAKRESDIGETKHLDFSLKNVERFACYASISAFKLNHKHQQFESSSYKPKYLGCMFGERVVENQKLSDWKGIMMYYYKFEKNADEKLEINPPRVFPSIGIVRFASNKHFFDEFALESNAQNQANRLLIYFIKGCSRLVVYGLLSDKERRGMVVYDANLSLVDPGKSDTAEHTKDDAKQGFFGKLFITDLKVRARINFPEEFAYDKEEITVMVDVTDPMTTIGSLLPPITIESRETERYFGIFCKNHIKTVIKGEKDIENFKCYGENNRLVLGLPSGKEEEANTVKIWLRKDYDDQESRKTPKYVEMFAFTFNHAVTDAHFSRDLKYLWLIFKNKQGVSQICQFKLNFPCGPVATIENCLNFSLLPTKVFTDGLLQIMVNKKYAILRDQSLLFNEDQPDQDKGTEISSAGLFDYSKSMDTCITRLDLSSISAINRDYDLHRVSASSGFREIYLLYKPISEKDDTEKCVEIYKLTYDRASQVLVLESKEPYFATKVFNYDVHLIGRYLKYMKSATVSEFKNIELGSTNAKDRSKDTGFECITGKEKIHMFGMVNDLLIVVKSAHSCLQLCLQRDSKKEELNSHPLDQKFDGMELVNDFNFLDDDLVRDIDVAQQSASIKRIPLVFFKKRVGILIVVLYLEDPSSPTQENSYLITWNYFGDVTNKPIISPNGNHVYFLDETGKFLSVSIDDIAFKAKDEVVTHPYDIEIENTEGIHMFVMNTYDLVAINRSLDQRSKWNRQVDDFMAVKENEHRKDFKNNPSAKKVDEKARFKKVKSTKLAVIEGRSHESRIKVNVWSLDEERVLYNFDVFAPREVCTGIFSSRNIKSSCLITKEAFHLSYSALVSHDAHRHSSGSFNDHRKPKKAEINFNIAYEVSPLSSRGKSSMLAYLFNAYMSTQNSDEKLTIEDKFLAYTNMIYPFKYSEVASKFSIYYTINDEEIFSSLIENINLNSLFYDCRLYELYFQDSRHAGSRKIIFESLQEYFVDLVTAKNTAINPREATMFLMQDNSTLMIDELSREFFKYLLQCASKIPNTLTLQLPDDKMRSLDVYERINDELSVSNSMKDIQSQTQGWFTKCCPNKNKSENNEYAAAKDRLKKLKAAVQEEQDFNFFNKMNFLKEYFQDKAKDKDFVTYQVHRSLAKIDMASGSTGSTNLFLTIEKLSDDDIRYSLLPLIYYKWDNLWYFSLLYSSLFWCMTIAAYAYFGFYIEDYALGYFVVVMNIIFLLYETKTGITLGWKQYWTSMWNIADVLLLAFCLGLVIFCLKIDFYDDRPIVALRIISVTLLWVRAITWLRVIGPLRHLIKMVLAVFLDMIAFLIIFATSIVGYTFIWRLSPLLAVYEYSATPEIQGFYDSFYTPVMIILGNGPEGEANSEQFGYFRFAVNLIGNIMLSFAFLNFLIAIISGTFEKIEEQKDLHDCKELLNMITEFNAFMEHLPFKKKVPSFFFTLHPVVKPNEEMKQLEEKVMDLTDEMNKRFETIEVRLIEEMNTKFDRMDDSIKAMVKQLTIEVRNIKEQFSLEPAKINATLSK